ncbi:MAG: rod-binding protein [Oceanicaulis sp.]
MDGLLDAQLQNALAAARSAGPDRPQRAQTPDQIAAAAEEFEAVFLAQMLEQMAGESTESSFAGGPGEAAFKGLLNEEYAKVMAKSGGIGLADALAREMLALQEAQER